MADALNTEHARLCAFVREVISGGFLGDWDGAALQECGVKHGLLEKVTVHAPCGDACECAAISDFPLECYRFTGSLAEGVANGP